MVSYYSIRLQYILVVFCLTDQKRFRKVEENDSFKFEMCGVHFYSTLWVITLLNHLKLQIIAHDFFGSVLHIKK